MLSGKVQWFSGPKGYGFLSRDDGGKDVFVHFSSIVGTKGYKSLTQDARVVYDLEEGPHGTQAANVKVVKE